MQEYYVSGMERKMGKGTEEENAQILAGVLAGLLEKYGAEKKDVIKASRLDNIYAYQIFAGKKNPKREKLIQLAFGFPLSVEDTNMLLQAGGYSALYVRDKRDAVCMYCLEKKMTLEECNGYMYQVGERTLEE